MIEKSNAVILHVTKHTDNTVIVDAYTEKYGRTAYVFSARAGKRAREGRALLTPFSMLSIECDYRVTKQIQKIKDIEALSVQTLQFDPVKGAVTLFLSDFLMHVIREPDPYPQFFKFLTDSITLYNVMQDGKANFHLCFLFGLSAFLGFYPDVNTYKEGAYFDMLNGVFTTVLPQHNHMLMPEDARHFATLSRMNFSNLHLFSFSRDERRAILERIIEYYMIHQEFAPLKSQNILKMLFD